MKLLLFLVILLILNQQYIQTFPLECSDCVNENSSSSFSQFITDKVAENSDTFLKIEFKDPDWILVDTGKGISYDYSPFNQLTSWTSLTSLHIIMQSNMDITTLAGNIQSNNIKYLKFEAIQTLDQTESEEDIYQLDDKFQIYDLIRNIPNLEEFYLNLEGVNSMYSISNLKGNTFYNPLDNVSSFQLKILSLKFSGNLSQDNSIYLNNIVNTVIYPTEEFYLHINQHCDYGCSEANYSSKYTFHQITFNTSTYSTLKILHLILEQGNFSQSQYILNTDNSFSSLQDVTFKYFNPVINIIHYNDVQLMKNFFLTFTCSPSLNIGFYYQIPQDENVEIDVLQFNFIFEPLLNCVKEYKAFDLENIEQVNGIAQSGEYLVITQDSYEIANDLQLFEQEFTQTYSFIVQQENDALQRIFTLKPTNRIHLDTTMDYLVGLDQNDIPVQEIILDIPTLFDSDYSAFQKISQISSLQDLIIKINDMNNDGFDFILSQISSEYLQGFNVIINMSENLEGNFDLLQFQMNNTIFDQFPNLKQIGGVIPYFDAEFNFFDLLSYNFQFEQSDKINQIESVVLGFDGGPSNRRYLSQNYNLRRRQLNTQVTNYFASFPNAQELYLQFVGLNTQFSVQYYMNEISQSDVPQQITSLVIHIEDYDITDATILDLSSFDQLTSLSIKLMNHSGTFDISSLLTLLNNNSQIELQNFNFIYKLVDNAPQPDLTAVIPLQTYFSQNNIEFYVELPGCNDFGNFNAVQQTYTTTSCESCNAFEISIDNECIYIGDDDNDDDQNNNNNEEKELKEDEKSDDEQTIIIVAASVGGAAVLGGVALAVTKYAKMKASQSLLKKVAPTDNLLTNANITQLGKYSFENPSKMTQQQFDQRYNKIEQEDISNSEILEEQYLDTKTNDQVSEFQVESGNKQDVDQIQKEQDLLKDIQQYTDKFVELSNIVKIDPSELDIIRKFSLSSQSNLYSQLKQRIKNKKPYSEKEFETLFLNVLEALKVMHLNNAPHKHLNPINVQYHKKLNIESWKLNIVGNQKKINILVQFFRYLGNEFLGKNQKYQIQIQKSELKEQDLIRYLSPEQMSNYEKQKQEFQDEKEEEEQKNEKTQKQDIDYNKNIDDLLASDIFSFGLLLSQVLTLDEQIPQINNDKELLEKYLEDVNLPLKSSKYGLLIEQMLQYDPKERITIEKICQKLNIKYELSKIQQMLNSKQQIVIQQSKDSLENIKVNSDQDLQQDLEFQKNKKQMGQSLLSPEMDSCNSIQEN